MLFRHILLIALFSLCTSASAMAQASRVRIPSETELNRLGLTLNWWGQAAVSASQERVLFFTADEENVYVQSDLGILTSFQAESGKRLWSQLVGRPNQQGFPPSAGEDDVLVSIGMRVYAFNKITGAPRWVLPLPSAASAPPKEDDQYLYVATFDGMMRAYDVKVIRNLAHRGMLPQWANRSELWNYQMPRASTAEPVTVDGEVVFASDGGYIYRISGPYKQLRFQLEAGANLSAPITYSRDYVFASDARARLLCMSINNGRLIWTYSSGSAIRDQPRVIGNQLFINVIREGLTAIDVKTGLKLWEQPVATKMVAASDTRVYATDFNNNLLILDRATGQIKGQLRTADFTIQVANDRTDRIFLATPTGLVIALRELGSEFPVYHLYPERRPILPDLAPEEGAETEGATAPEKAEKTPGQDE